MITDKDILLHLKEIQKLICQGCAEGFNPEVGDWAEKLFHSNQKISDILKERTGSHDGATLEKQL